MYIYSEFLENMSARYKKTKKQQGLTFPSEKNPTKTGKCYSLFSEHILNTPAYTMTKEFPALNLLCLIWSYQITLVLNYHFNFFNFSFYRVFPVRDRSNVIDSWKKILKPLKRSLFPRVRYFYLKSWDLLISSHRITTILVDGIKDTYYPKNKTVISN